jgi:hypothetical protein
LSAEIDGQVLKWTFDALDEDHELLQFFEGIPGFCSSKVVDEPRGILAKLDDRRLRSTVEGFLSRTCSSSLLSNEVKQRRIAVCFQAIDALDLSFPSWNFIDEVCKPGRDEMFWCIQMGRSLRSRCRHSDDDTAFCAQAMVAGIIARVPGRDHRWKALVKDQLGISEVVLQDYLAHGDSVLLANLIHINRQCVHFCHVHGNFSFSLSVIQRTISQFDIRNTLPGLQHDFCAFWNEVSRQESNFSLWILRPIRHLYIALHCKEALQRANILSRF